MDLPEGIEISESALIQIYLVVFISFLFGVSFIIFCVYYLRRIFTQQLQVKQLESEHRKNLLQASLQAQEKERARLASDLHDDVGASLATIKLYASHLHANSTDSFSQNPAQKITELIDQTVVNIRQLSQNLLPVHLEKFGLLKTIEEKCQQINESNQGIQAMLDYEPNLPLSNEQSLHLYRIIQELLNNTLKHAAASQIHLSIKKQADRLQLIYKDNGKGFDTSIIDAFPIEQTSLGMKTIASRAELLNANMSYQSAPQQGLSVKIDFSI